VAKAYEDVTGSLAMIEGVTYGSDARHLVNVGNIPTVLFGPGDVRLCHRPDESVPVDDLVKATRVLALTITRFCGIH
jgi:acetylornithine deacetylase